MPRRAPNPSVLEVIVRERWTVAAVASVICFVVGFWIGPSILASTPVFRPLAAIIRALSLIPTAVLALIAVIKFLKESADKTHTATIGRPKGTVGDIWNTAPSATVAPIRQVEPTVRPAPTEWSLALLHSIEWKRFEEVVAAYFRAKNFRCETQAYGPDGGVDGRLYFGELPDAVGVVQCKAWGPKPVDVAPVRELLGVVAHENVWRGYFCTTGTFTNNAITFAKTNPVKLINGQDFLDAIAGMPVDAQKELLAVSTEGDYTTPTCASCGVKLIKKTIGAKEAWACRNYPRCRVKIFVRSPA